MYRPGVVGEILESMFNAFVGPAALVKPAVDAGMVYRLTWDRWSLYPSIGLGYATYAADRHMSRKQQNDEGQEIQLTYEQKASFFTANAGVSLNYYFGSKSFLVLNTAFRQPLQTSSASLVQETNGIETMQQSYSTTAGRTVYATVGYGFILGRKKRESHLF